MISWCSSCDYEVLYLVIVTFQVDIFQVEAVDIGTVHELVVEKGHGSDWHLEKIVVEDPSLEGKKLLFMAQTWLRDRTDKKKFISVTLNVTGQYYLKH